MGSGLYNCSHVWVLDACRCETLFPLTLHVQSVQAGRQAGSDGRGPREWMCWLKTIAGRCGLPADSSCACMHHEHPCPSDYASQPGHAARTTCLPACLLQSGPTLTGRPHRWVSITVSYFRALKQPFYRAAQRSRSPAARKATQSARAWPVVVGIGHRQANNSGKHTFLWLLRQSPNSSRNTPTHGRENLEPLRPRETENTRVSMVRLRPLFCTDKAGPLPTGPTAPWMRFHTSSASPLDLPQHPPTDHAG